MSPAYQEVCSLTFDTTPSDSIRFSSSKTFARNGIGTFLGLLASFSLIVYGSPKSPSPSNTLGNCNGKVWFSWTKSSRSGFVQLL